MKPKFAKRHYWAVARTIQKCPVYTGGNDEQTLLSIQQMECLIERFVEMFAEDNDRFIPARFRDACAGDRGPYFEVTKAGKEALLKGVA